MGRGRRTGISDGGDNFRGSSEDVSFNKSAVIEELQSLAERATNDLDLDGAAAHYARVRASNLAKAIANRELGPVEVEHIRAATLFLGAQVQDPAALQTANQIKSRLGLPDWVRPEHAVLVGRWEEVAAELSSFPAGRRALHQITEGAPPRQAALDALPGPEEHPHRILGAIHLGEALLASGSSLAVARAGNFVEENISEIQELAALPGRAERPDHILLASDKVWMYHWAQSPLGGSGDGTLGWVSEGGALGGGRVSAVVVEEENGSINLSEIFRCALHEGIHLNQEPYQRETSYPPGWAGFEAEQLLEGMTEGLAILRCRSEDRDDLRDVFRPHRLLPGGEVVSGEDVLEDSFYTQEVAAVFTVLEEAGVDRHEMESVLAQLQTLPLPEVVARLEDQIGKDPLPLFRQALERWKIPVYVEDTPNSKKWEMKALRKRLSYISKVFQKQKL